MRRALVLVGVVLLAALARFWAIDFGLPHTRSRPDETKIVRILESPWNGFHPGTFAYPSLQKYLVLGLDGVYYAIGRASGRFTDARDLLAEYVAAPGNLYLVNRLLAATLGVLTVLLVYRLGLRVAGRRTALLGALFLALCHLHARDSHFGVTDVPMTFWIVAAVLFLLRALESGALRDYLLAGTLAGLAASTKYSGVFLVVPAVLAHHAYLRASGRPLRRLVTDGRLLAFGLAAAVCFWIGTPYSLLDTETFLRDVTRDAHHFHEGHGLDLGRGWWVHATFSLPLGLGWPLFGAALAGGIALVLRRPRRAAVLLAFPLVFYLVSGAGKAVFVRYALPLTPFLCLTAAFLVDELARRLTGETRRGATRRGAALATGLALLLLLPSAWRVLQTDRLLARRDNRLIAAEWIAANVPRGATLHQTGSRSAQLELPESLPQLERSKPTLTMLLGGPGWLAETPLGASLAHERGYEEWDFDEETGRFTRAKRPVRGLPDYVVRIDSPLERYERTPAALLERLERDYELLVSFAACDATVEANRYDEIDAFYLPYAGFEGVERPGPNVAVYRRR